MIFIRMMRLYYCRRIVYFVTDIETFIVMDVPIYVTAITVVTYVVYFLCALMTSAYISTFGVRTVMEINIGVRTIVGSNR